MTQTASRLAQEELAAVLEWENGNLSQQMANLNIAISDPVVSILRNCADVKVLLPVTEAWPAACSAEVVRPSQFSISPACLNREDHRNKRDQ
ncbi:hypothetical protein PG991_015547 [Apiospora marii]|uniref:Uncharacterized protein n=1 Tax=Apiospora marii TaxID=335849 RepID=A0ABR1R2M4_9PEZI